MKIPNDSSPRRRPGPSDLDDLSRWAPAFAGATNYIVANEGHRFTGE
jgi:hypothetical protein